VIDPARATLRDLVEDVLKEQLQYGDELSVNNEVGILYDPELDDNLSKKFSDLGIKADSFLTVVDEDDNNPRVNLSLSISEK
jgi:ubiquitin-like 1-activating enzyme E1 B